MLQQLLAGEGELSPPVALLAGQSQSWSLERADLEKVGSSYTSGDAVAPSPWSAACPDRVWAAASHQPSDTPHLTPPRVPQTTASLSPARPERLWLPRCCPRCFNRRM